MTSGTRRGAPARSPMPPSIVRAAVLLVVGVACRTTAPTIAPEVRREPVVAAKPVGAIVPPASSPVHLARSIAVATSHACAVIDDGTVRCWGRPSGGVLGVERTNVSEVAEPVAVPGTAHVRMLAADRSRTCAVHDDGTLSCWGEVLVFENDGQLVAGGTTMPRPIPGMADVLAVALGPLDACALRSDATARCWGDARSALRKGAGAKPDDPFYTTRLPKGTTALAIGGGHACALDEAGVVWCWGPNAQGQLGVGDTKPRDRPTRVELSARVRSIAAANTITCAVTDEGELWCWGGTRCPPLGDCSLPDFAVERPRRIDTREPMQDVVLGEGGGALLDRRGAAWRLSPELALTRGVAVHGIAVDGLVQVGFGLRPCGLGQGGSVVCWRDDGGATRPEPIVFE